MIPPPDSTARRSARSLAQPPQRGCRVGGPGRAEDSDREGPTAEMMVSAPLYMRILGDSWTGIAEPIRRLHATHSIIRAHGRLRIEHGRHFLARVLARMLRLPRPSAAAETQLIVTARARRRTLAADVQRAASRNAAVPNRATAELAERFGVLEFRFRLDASGGSLPYVQRDAAFVVRAGPPADTRDVGASRAGARAAGRTEARQGRRLRRRFRASGG